MASNPKLTFLVMYLKLGVIYLSIIAMKRMPEESGLLFIIFYIYIYMYVDNLHDFLTLCWKLPK